MKIQAVSVLLLSVCTSLCSYGADYPIAHDAEVDVCTVTNTVQVPNARRFGLNYAPWDYSHWRKAIIANIWNRYGAFEPRVQVNWNIVEKGDSDSFICDKGWGLSGWNKWTSGFWDGADIWVYGLKDGRYQEKRKGKITQSLMGKDTVDTFTVDGVGPAFEPGDIIYVKQVSLKPNPHQRKVTAKGQKIKKNGVDYFSKSANMIGNTTWELVTDPCPEAGSTAAMKLTTLGEGGFFTFHTGGTDERFHKWPEGDFRWEGWLKRSTPGVFTVDFGGVVSQQFEVGTEWKKYSFEFNPQEMFKEYTSKTTRYSLTVPDACDIYLDNILLYRTGLEPFQTEPEIVEKLAEYNGGMIRIETIGTRLLDTSLSLGLNQVQSPDTCKGGFSAMTKAASAASVLKMCGEVQANPWMLTPAVMTMDDCDHLMEYFGAPADVGYGAKRAAHGQVAPWLDVFSEIYIEIDNEQWGRNFSHCFNTTPQIYAKVADMFIRRMKESPYYDANKIKFVCNGWGNTPKRGGWTEQVATSSVEADIIDVAFYFGGWDGITLLSDDNTELYQSRMLFGTHIVEKKLIEALRINPALGMDLATALQDKPALQQDILPYLTVELQSIDKGIQSLLKVLMTVPTNELFGTLYNNSVTLQQLVSEAFGFEPAERGDYDLKEVFYHDPKYIHAFIKQYPEQARALALRYDVNDSVKEAIETVISGQKPKRFWTIYNTMIPTIQKHLNSAFQNNENLIADVRATVPALNPHTFKRKFVRNASDILTRAVSGQVSELFAVIQENPEEALHSLLTNEAYLSQYVEVVAENVIETLKTTLASYNAASFDVDKLDPLSRSTILANLARVLSEDQIFPERDCIALLSAIAQAQSESNLSVLNQLNDDVAFLSGLQNRISNAFGESLIVAMSADNRIAEQLLPAYDALPKNPSIGHKQMANYEAGPGYPLPGPGKSSPEEAEEFGKSLALGVTTLDSFMHELERGFGYQNYFKFSFGTYWTTHTDNTTWRRNPSYEALLMVNNYCKGDLLIVDNSQVKRWDIPQIESSHIDNAGKVHLKLLDGRKNVPLIKCYSFKDGKKYSTLIYNRSFTEARTVQLSLPYTPETDAIIHKLTASSPMDTNRKELKVRQVEERINDFKNNYQVTLKPAEIFILTNVAQ